ncbi:MAG: YigZ family protein [Candidatus Puniceispirillaceae bacterium]
MSKLITMLSVLADRGSKYAVSGGHAAGRADVDIFLKQLKKTKKFAKATHHSWALLSSNEGPVKNDDGESGAGMVILRMLERAHLQDHVIIVTRWYGGTKLGGDRFRHVQEAVRIYLAEQSDEIGNA